MTSPRRIVAPPPARPRLAEALAVVVDASVEELAAALPALRDRDGVVYVRVLWSGLPACPPFERWRITDAREAWEAMALAGLIGPQDVDCATRRFWRGHPHFVDVALGRTPPDLGSHPERVAECVFFASDWPAVLRAEHLVREYAALRGAPRDELAWMRGGYVGVIDAVRDVPELKALGDDVRALGYGGLVGAPRIEMFAPC